MRSDSRTVIVDSSGLISLISETDSNYKNAIKIGKLLEAALGSAIIPSDVFSETLNIVGKKLGHSKAIDTAEKIFTQEAFVIIETDEKLRRSAFNLFKKQPENDVAPASETERDPTTIKFLDILALMDVSPEILDDYFQPFLAVNVGDTLSIEDVNRLKGLPNFNRSKSTMQGTDLYFNSVPGYEGRDLEDQDEVYIHGFNQGTVYQTRTTIFPIPGGNKNLILDDVLNLGVKETATRTYQNGAVTHVFAKNNQGFAVTCLPTEQDPNDTVIKVEFFADPNWGYPVTSYDQQWWWWNDNSKGINES